jgi:hypothetical protein
MGDVVLVPHLALHGFNVVIVVTVLSCAIRKCTNTLAFKLTDTLRMYATSSKDNCANGVVVSNSGARGDVHHGHSGADDANGDADNIIC